MSVFRSVLAFFLFTIHFIKIYRKGAIKMVNVRKRGKVDLGLVLSLTLVVISKGKFGKNNFYWIIVNITIIFNRWC